MFREKIKILKTAITSILVISLLVSMFAFKCFSICEVGQCFDNPIIISSIQDFEVFADDIEEGNSYSGKFISLKSDIVIDKYNKALLKNFEEMGSLIKGIFDGNLDCNNYTITLKTNSKTKGTENILFNSLGKNAKVKNLKVKFDFI